MQFRTLVTIILVIVGFFVSYRIFDVWLLHSELEKQLKDFSHQSLIHPGMDLHEVVIGRMESVEGDFEPEQDVVIDYNGKRNKVSLSLYYVRYVDLGFMTFPWELEVDFTTGLTDAKKIMNSFQQSAETMSERGANRTKNQLKKSLNESLGNP